mgnify:FL=1
MESNLKKILIVDDEISILKLLRHYLSEFYDVKVFSDGSEAFLWMQEGSLPDLIVADIQMPTVDGLEFLKQLKMSEFYKSIPVIMLSSLDSSEDRINYLKHGARDYLIKPFNPEELYIRIKKIFEN